MFALYSLPYGTYGHKSLFLIIPVLSPHRISPNEKKKV